MFTGIIETTAKIIQKNDSGITITRPDFFRELTKGQSVAVNGACLSVVEFDSKKIRFDVVSETFARTNLEKARVVNLERALPADGRFEGHVVAGHVDGTVKLLGRKKKKIGERFTFELPSDFAHLFVEKGSVALNGVSLTIAALQSDSFSVAVIPQTLKKTNLGMLKKGDAVNFEADLLGKYLQKWFRERSFETSS